MSSRIAVLGIVLLVVLAGCSGGFGGGAGGGGDAAEAPDGGDGARASGDGGGGGDSDGGDGGESAAAAEGNVDSRRAVQPGQRAIVRTGTVVLTVEDYDATRGRLASAARERGGWVAGSEETQHRRGNRTWTTGRLVLRVPSEEFTGTFGLVKSAGEVESASSDTQDVTDRLVDLEARLENLRAKRDRLRKLYDEANDTESVLAVGDRLSEVQGEIERLEAEKRSLERRVAFSTITVELREPEPEPTPTPTPTPTPAYHEVGLVSAFLSSVQGTVVALRTIAVTAAYAAPYAVVFGVPLAGLAWATRRRDVW